MDPARHKKMSELFLEAVELAPAERKQFLEQRCPDDPDLRTAVASLLLHDGQASWIPSQGTTIGFPATGHDTSTRPMVGPYKILEVLGRGGMGIVYLAEQERPIRRSVALKVIKPGMDSSHVIARFEAERQALAVMDHPNVAKVFDAGTTEHGRPFFVMEYVQGIPLTRHCDRHKLTTRERLRLFVEVCHGVQHAHQKAIIHRDLKPSNVLVALQEGRAVAKIIDFGVAKAMAQKLTERTMFTELGVLIGTPEYMSPEQADIGGQGVDTRTDVYSLGVMLYELLVGALPFDSEQLRGGGYEGLRRKIREEQPRRPSTRLSKQGQESAESAQRRGVDLPTLQRQLRGDLDWIVMRAMEKDRSRRYGSPAELALDIERHLRDEPVMASPPSTAYRAGKFVRRHKLGVAISLVAVTVLAAFAGTMAVQAARIAVARDRAQTAAHDLESVVEFQAGMLAEVDPQAMGRSLLHDLRERVRQTARQRGDSEDEVQRAVARYDASVQDVNPTDLALRVVDHNILARAGTTLDERFAEQPLIQARLRDTIGQTYDDLGLYEQAQGHLRRAVEVRRRVLGADHPQTLGSMDSLATLYTQLGRYADAERLHLETLRARRRVLGNEHPDTLTSSSNLASLYVEQERQDEAEPLYLETLESRRRSLGADHPDTLASINNLAILYFQKRRYDEAEPLYLEALETHRRLLGDDHPKTLLYRSNLALLYKSQGRYDDAESMYLAALEARKSTLGSDHPATLNTMNGLAHLYVLQGRHDDAEPLYLKALESRTRVLGHDHPDTLTSINRLGRLLLEQGHYDEARARLREALEGRIRVFSDEHLHVGYSYYDLGCLAALLGQRGEALDYLRKAVQLGWAQASILNDTMLESLRGDPEFEAIVGDVQQRIGEG